MNICMKETKMIILNSPILIKSFNYTMNDWDYFITKGVKNQVDKNLRAYTIYVVANIYGAKIFCCWALKVSFRGIIFVTSSQHKAMKMWQILTKAPLHVLRVKESADELALSTIFRSTQPPNPTGSLLSLCRTRNQRVVGLNPCISFFLLMSRYRPSDS
jgi:hypothetical protein